MRKKYVAGNWKMNLDAAAASELASTLAQQYGKCSDKAAVDMAVCPPFVYLAMVKEALGDSGIKLGAQDVFYEGNGAYTGEISVDMLKDIGCDFVLVGHSERRSVIGESNEILNKKTKAALAGGLDVIFCIGELLEEREGGKMEAVLETQLREGLVDITAGTGWRRSLSHMNQYGLLVLVLLLLQNRLRKHTYSVVVFLLICSVRKLLMLLAFSTAAVLNLQMQQS